MKSSLLFSLALVTFLATIGAGCASSKPSDQPTTSTTTVTAQDLEQLKTDVQSVKFDDLSAIK